MGLTVLSPLPSVSCNMQRSQTCESPLKQLGNLTVEEEEPQQVDLVALYVDACAHCGCRVNSSVSKLLAKAPTKVLDELSLRNNYVGPKGIHAILFLIEKCQTLQHLDLSGNGLDNPAVELLCAVLERHLGISHLDVSNNPLTHDVGKFLMRLVENNPRITSVRIANTDIFPSLVSRIEMAAAENASSGAPEVKAADETSPHEDAQINRQQSDSKVQANKYPIPPPSRGAIRAVPTQVLSEARPASSPRLDSPVRPSTRGAVVSAAAPSSASPHGGGKGSGGGNVMKPRPPPPAIASAQHSRLTASQKENVLQQYRQRREHYGAIALGTGGPGQPNDVRDVAANTRYQLMALEAADLRVRQRRYQRSAEDKEDNDVRQLLVSNEAAVTAALQRNPRTATDRGARAVNKRGDGEAMTMAEEEAVAEAITPTVGTGAANILKDPITGRDVVHSKDTSVPAFEIPYTKDEQFKVLFDAGCDAYAQRNLEVAYLRWNEAMTYAAEHKNREWIAIVTSNLQRLSFELLVAEGNAFVEKSRLDEADKRFAFAQEVAKKARNAAWEQDMIKARKNVQHAVFTSNHERSTKLLEQVLKYQHQPLADGEQFLSEDGSSFVRHTEVYHNEYQRLLLLKEAIEGWVSALAVARKITGPSSRVLQDVVQSSMLNVTEFLVQHLFATSAVIKGNGDMAVASKLGTSGLTFEEAKTLHDVWVELINITDSLGCKIFDVVTLMYVGHLAIAMNAMQQAVSYFENAVLIADSLGEGAQSPPPGRNPNRPSSSTSAAPATQTTTTAQSPVNAKTAVLDDPIVRGYAYAFLAELHWQRASFGAAEKAARKAGHNFEMLQMYESITKGDSAAEIAKESFANNGRSGRPDDIEESSPTATTFHLVGSSLFYKVIPTYIIRHMQYLAARTLVHTLVSTHRYHDALETLELALLNRHSDSLRRKILKNFASKPTIDHIVAVAASTGASIIYYETATRLSFSPMTGKYVAEESLFTWVVPPEGEVSFSNLQVTKDYGFASVESLIYQARNTMYVDPIAKMYWKRNADLRKGAGEEIFGDDEAEEPGGGAFGGQLATITSTSAIEEMPDLLWKTPLQNLFSILIDPIKGFLSAHGGYSEFSVVTIVPTGALWGVPFTALLDAKDDTFLVEKFAPQLSFGALFTTFSVISALQVTERAHKKAVVEFTDDVDEATMNVVLRRYLVPFPGDAVRARYEALRLRKVIVECQYQAQCTIEALHRASGGVIRDRYGDVLSSQNIDAPFMLHDMESGGSISPTGYGGARGNSDALRGPAPDRLLPGDDDLLPPHSNSTDNHGDDLDDNLRIVNVPPSMQPPSIVVHSQEELRGVLPHARFVHLTAPSTAFMAGTGNDSTAGGLCMPSEERGGVSILRSSDVAATEIFSSVVSLSQLNINQPALNGTNGAREGTLCLLRALAAAGCPSVVGTLWCTPDMTPHTVLESFYKEYLSHTGGLQPIRPRVAAQHTNDGEVFSPLVVQRGRLVKAHTNSNAKQTKNIRPNYANKAVALALALRKLLQDADIRYAPRMWAPYFMVGVGDE